VSLAGRRSAQYLSVGSRYASVSEIGEAENISKSHASRILRLALLAPDIVEANLAGKTDQALVLGKPERPLPASSPGVLSAISHEPILQLGPVLELPRYRLY
jgi:hypothetical protein